MVNLNMAPGMTEDERMKWLKASTMRALGFAAGRWRLVDLPFQLKMIW
jgi:hypothetical protein